MAKLSLFICLFLSSLLATAQEIEQNRLLANDYQPQPLEQALANLTAANVVTVRTQVEYVAGQSVILYPGFTAKAGSVFTARTGMVSSPALAEGALTSLTLSTYPNPFDKVTTITYVLPKPGLTNLQISDAEGRLIQQLVNNQYQEAGRHSVEWQGSGIIAGLYICVLEAGPRRLSKRIIRR